MADAVFDGPDFRCHFAHISQEPERVGIRSLTLEALASKFGADLSQLMFSIGGGAIGHGFGPLSCSLGVFEG